MKETGYVKYTSHLQHLLRIRHGNAIDYQRNGYVDAALSNRDHYHPQK